jgi:L-arabonate dehydrase
MSGGYGTVGLHVSPEAASGPLAPVHNGDMIKLDVPSRRIQLEIDDATLSRRHAQWTPPPAPKCGWEKLDFDHVLQAHEGADLDFLVGCSGAAIPREGRTTLEEALLQSGQYAETYFPVQPNRTEEA